MTTKYPFGKPSLTVELTFAGLFIFTGMFLSWSKSYLVKNGCDNRCSVSYLKFEVAGLCCPLIATKVRNEIEQLAGVTFVVPDTKSQSVRVKYQDAHPTTSLASVWNALERTRVRPLRVAVRCEECPK